MALWGLCGSKSIIQLTAWMLPGPASFPSSPLPPLQFPSLCLVETNQVFVGFRGRGGVGGLKVAPNAFALVLASLSCQRGLEGPGNMFLPAWDHAKPFPPGWAPSFRLALKGHNPDLTCSLNQRAELPLDQSEDGRAAVPVIRKLVAYNFLSVHCPGRSTCLTVSPPLYFECY